MDRPVTGSVESEFRRYKQIAEGALAQLTDEEILEPGPGGIHSAATIVWHIAGNLTSRFTDFLTSDGEKPWRDRESEFQAREVPRSILLSRWEEGWQALFQAIKPLADAELERTVAIRGVALPVHEALHRALAHISYHVGQIVHIARGYRGDSWIFLSPPPDRPTGSE
jgi:uncharacterized damage-inducible protein DinB